MLRFQFVLMLFCLPVLSWSLENQAEMINQETRQVAEKLGAAYVSEVQFEVGSYDLKPQQAEEVKRAIQAARKDGAQSIKEVKIVAWSDREYPSKHEKDTNTTVKLADKRANELQRYLQQELNISEVNKYNMAKRPSALQEMLNTGSAKVKQNVEKSGVATSPSLGSSSDDLQLNGKASKALILIYTR